MEFIKSADSIIFGFYLPFSVNSRFNNSELRRFKGVIVRGASLFIDFVALLGR